MTSASTPTLTLGLANYSDDSPGDWSVLFEQAEIADRAGIDRLAVVDHLVLGGGTDDYEPGGFPTGLGGAWLEPLTVLSVLAGRTASVRLGTAILVAPLRRPVVLAKALATLDVLSGGRLDVGVGIGWHRPEYTATGLDFGSRGALLDETLRVCRTLWAPSPASYRSDTLSFDDIWCEPKPWQEGGPPVWLSGTLNPRNAARIVAFGSGWIPWGDDRRDPAGSIRRLRRLLEEAGRDPESVVVQGPLPAVATAGGRLDLAATLEPVAALVADGVGDFVVRVPASVERSFDQAMATELVGRFREAAR